MLMSDDSKNLWSIIVSEAKQQGINEPVLASFFHANILSHRDFSSALSFQIASKLGSDSVPTLVLRQTFEECFLADKKIVESATNDLVAWYERDPACDQYSIPLLYFKGFHALQAYRIAHWLWLQERFALALFLQNAVSTVFDVDIHPGATMGSGIMIDHATGVVIGETSVVGNNVSLLHAVTLGGCGSRVNDRHPKVGNGVLISTGAKLLGDITVGDGAKIAAGSLVLVDVEPHTTVAGVPSRVVGRPLDEQPALEMNQQINDS
jgi:serine O-acetyltransferase